jgi:hypothetical protein
MNNFKDEYENNESYVESLGTPRVFMHEINTLPNFSKILETVDEIEKYERTLAIARPEDVILTKVSPEKAYLDWLKSVGLGSQNLIVLDGQKDETMPERVLKNGAKTKIEQFLGSKKAEAVFCPYFGGPLEEKASKHLQLRMYANTNLVTKYDSKINFKKLCQEAGVPVLEEVILKGKSKYSVSDLKENFKKILELKDKTGKIIIKGEFGASGSTTQIFDDFDITDLKDFFHKCRTNERFIVEPLYRRSSSPSSVWFITTEKVCKHVKTSNQLLSDGIVHSGNEFPVPFDEKIVIELTHKIAKCLSEEGYIGPFGVDYIESDNKLYAVECNPRVTGANYPWELVNLLSTKHEKIKAARAENIHLSRKGLTFEDLMKKWRKVLYTGEHGLGVVVPYNVGPVASGKVTVLGTGSSKEEVDDLFKFVKANA